MSHLFDGPAAYVCESCGRLSHDPSGNCEHGTPVSLYELAALDRESLIGKATAHFMDADDHLSPETVCRGRAVGLLADLGLIEEEDHE